VLDKIALRSELMARRAAMPAAARAVASASLVARAGMIAEAAGTGVVSGFWPIREEIDPRALLEALHLRGVPLALPVVTGEGLIFRAWQPGDALARASFGLLEPEQGAATVAPALMLVPLLGFDRSGGRIGYGRGFYDGAIARLAPRLTIGLAVACQEVPVVPREAHDRLLDRILTENEPIDCRAASRE
jgi:5-formyltetrahydrofolate cyclo-ligase